MDYVEKYKQVKEQKKWKNKAEKYLNNDEQAKGLLLEVAKKADNKKSGPLKEVNSGLQSLMMMFKDYLNGSYKKIPTKTLLMIVMGLVYFVSPIDLVPDFILALGFVDDASVLAFLIHQIAGDIKEYESWKAEKETEDAVSQ